MTDIEKLTGMTDAECEYWDKHIIENTVEPGPNLLKLDIKPGFFNKALQISELDREVLAYLCVQAESFQKSPTQVLNELVHEKLAAEVNTAGGMISAHLENAKELSFTG